MARSPLISDQQLLNKLHNCLVSSCPRAIPGGVGADSRSAHREQRKLPEPRGRGGRGAPWAGGGGGGTDHNCVMVPWPEGKTACLERKELYCLKFLCIKYRTNKLRWGSSIGLCGILSCPSACLLVSHRAYTHKSET